jgi:ACS family allantoate permease-like MFS transporter
MSTAMTTAGKSDKDLGSTTVVPADVDEKNLGHAPYTEKHQIALADADGAAAFVAGFSGDIDPKEADRVRRKIDWNLLPLM